MTKLTNKLLSNIFFGSAVLLSGCQASTDTENQDTPTITEVAEFDPSTILTTGEALKAATDEYWRDLDPANTIYMELESGTVVIELAPQFAPNHVTNIKTLVRENYFDDLFVIRSHDNYVAQWGDADEDNPKSFGSAKATLDPEWVRDWPDNLPFNELKDGDIYQKQAGLSYGFPVAGDKNTNKIGMAHCYGMVGVGRGGEANSGNGSSLYVVTGHAPRHLDRNVTLVGKVLLGVEHLSSLPRGTGPLGFYETPEEYAPVKSIRLASEVAPEDRINLQVMRTDTTVYEDYLDARRYRKEEWFLDPAGRLELCNAPVPVRKKSTE
ncbi:MAG: peptidylprolyl isomerase [Hellea sp.]|nr:peptidylprolyl isomerase [Hellea sp.]